LVSRLERQGLIESNPTGLGKHGRACQGYRTIRPVIAQMPGGEGSENGQIEHGRTRLLYLKLSEQALAMSRTFASLAEPEERIAPA
jgi:hypothetical protein